MTECFPIARKADLVTTDVEDEVLLYDQRVHHLHRLNGPAAAVWRYCDGQFSVADIARLGRMDESSVRIALTNLAAAELLDADLPADMRLTNQSRRRFLKRAAVARTVPVIVSVTAPMAAMAGLSDTPPCGVSGMCDPEIIACRCYCENDPKPRIGDCTEDGTCSRVTCAV